MVNLKRQSSNCETATMVSIYVLGLQHNKYYVGKSTLPEARILDHFRGAGSAWTQLHKPKKIVEVLHNCSDFEEDKVTKEYMQIYGIDNVRGGTYTQIELDSSARAFLEREIRGASDACLRCGRDSHFAQDCYARTDINGNQLSPNSNAKKRSTPSNDVTTTTTTKRPYTKQPQVNSCTRCGRQSHTASQCYAKTILSSTYVSYSDSDSESESDGDNGDCCFRCGRPGHWAESCYARTDVNGKRLS